MPEVFNCRQCGKHFTRDRSDRHFCSGACVAAYYRDNPNPEQIHAEKPHVHNFACEFCGEPFVVNDYANRTGTRRPKYCSNKCKQAAYRARGQATQKQAPRRPRNPGKASNSKSGSKQTSNPSKPPESAKNGQWDTFKKAWSWDSNFKKMNPRVILDVSTSASKLQVKMAYLKVIQKVHPDKHPQDESEYWNELTQAVNWAYGRVTGI